MLCVFHRERTSENEPTAVADSQIPVGIILELLGSSSKSILLHHSSLLRHSTVLRHSSFLCHVIMLLYNSTSSNNLATNLNTPIRLFNCIIEILVLATAAFRTFRHLSTHLFYCRDSASLTGSKSMFPTLQLNYYSQFCYYWLLIVALRSTPLILCIATLPSLHFCIR